MVQKKICLLGSFAVGKTSLISQFVDSIFDDRYLTTVGVKITKKVVVLESAEVMLMIWDLAGEDDYSTLQTSYLRGASGYILVADGTRQRTLDVAMALHERTQNELHGVPAVLAVNKCDLVDEWVVSDNQRNELATRFELLTTSAKTGENVDQLFETLSRNML
jgi:small GTP-binding protein